MRRSEKAMKYWGFYISEELKCETTKYAINLNVSDSEYIRKAIECFNEQQLRPIIKCEKIIDGSGMLTGGTPFAKPTILEIEPDNRTVEFIKGIDKQIRQSNTTVQELKEKVKEMEKPTMVKSFLKG